MPVPRMHVLCASASSCGNAEPPSTAFNGADRCLGESFGKSGVKKRHWMWEASAPLVQSVLHSSPNTMGRRLQQNQLGLAPDQRPVQRRVGPARAGQSLLSLDSQTRNSSLTATQGTISATSIATCESFHLQFHLVPYVDGLYCNSYVARAQTSLVRKRHVRAGLDLRSCWNTNVLVHRSRWNITFWKTVRAGLSRAESSCSN